MDIDTGTIVKIGPTSHQNLHVYEYKWDVGTLRKMLAKIVRWNITIYSPLYTSNEYYM